MATQVDQRVVQMQFDNKQFEAGIQETLQSLNKLNDTIEENTKKTGKEMFSGMESQLSKANSSFNQMNSSLDVMTKKFSALGTISDQVLRNIGNSVSSFFHKGLSMITSGPREGFKEYEDMMGSVIELNDNSFIVKKHILPRIIFDCFVVTRKMLYHLYPPFQIR